MIVECGCVHQHLNDDPDNEAILLVFKAKPLFLFMHLLFQKIVSYPPDEATPGHEDFRPAQGFVSRPPPPAPRPSPASGRKRERGQAINQEICE